MLSLGLARSSGPRLSKAAPPRGPRHSKRTPVLLGPAVPAREPRLSTPLRLVAALRIRMGGRGMLRVD